MFLRLVWIPSTVKFAVSVSCRPHPGTHILHLGWNLTALHAKLTLNGAEHLYTCRKMLLISPHKRSLLKCGVDFLLISIGFVLKLWFTGGLKKRHTNRYTLPIYDFSDCCTSLSMLFSSDIFSSSFSSWHTVWLTMSLCNIKLKNKTKILY